MVRVPVIADEPEDLRKFSLDFGRNIMDMNRLPVDDGSASRTSTAQWVVQTVRQLGMDPCEAADPQDFTINAKDHSIVCVT